MKKTVKSKVSKKKRLVIVILVIVFIPVIYYGTVMTSAYFQSLSIVSQELQSGKIVLKLEDISSEYQEILLKVEDPAFYLHNGIDLSTPGAGYTTITQALVKQYFFEKFHPGLAKIKQTLIAWVFNKRVDKQTQLLLFINNVYLGTVQGQDINGLEQGAKIYYGKSFKQLTKDEYISLVAMIIAPNEFSVKNKLTKNQDRVKRIKLLLEGKCQPTSFKDVYYEQCK